MDKKEINIPILARVEGEGALDLLILSGKIDSLHLKIYEPPRLFEQCLVGREPNEVIDAVARICGICPVAYQMSATQALEQIFQIHPAPWIDDMRRLFYCGEWMESHSIHIHMLAAPDFLGFPSFIEMAKKYPEIAKRGLKLHSLGRALMSLIGKRSVHPVGACVGGFYRAPKEDAVKKLLSAFEESVDLAESLVKWAISLPFPKHHSPFTSVSLQHPREYPINNGKIVSDKGLSIESNEFESHFVEKQVPYSNALHCQLAGENYLVGPLARMNNNHQLMPEKIKTLLKNSHFSFPSQNMFHSIVARSVEVYYAVLEAIRIMKNYVYVDPSSESFTVKAGSGFGCTEAPRGLLWQSYVVGDDGLVKSAKIIPPTSQNQSRIEEDLRDSLSDFGLHQSNEKLRSYAEMIIRNYDPCISCSTHFLTLNVDRK